MPRKPVDEADKELVIGQIALGKGHSVSARVIANATNLRLDRTDVKVRSIISALIEDGQPIGSCSDGYYLIETEEELAEVVEQIQVRIRGMQWRIRTVRKNFREAR
jgi:hypothetical protein